MNKRRIDLLIAHLELIGKGLKFKLQDEKVIIDFSNIITKENIAIDMDKIIKQHFNNDGSFLEDVEFKLGNNKELIIENWNGFSIECGNQCNLFIGNESEKTITTTIRAKNNNSFYTGDNCNLICGDNNTIETGKNCNIKMGSGNTIENIGEFTNINGDDKNIIILEQVPKMDDDGTIKLGSGNEIFVKGWAITTK